MAFIVITMVVIVAVAGLVVAFVAFPHRGEELPGDPWLGEAMDGASGAIPTPGEDVRDEHTAIFDGAGHREQDARH